MVSAPAGADRELLHARGLSVARGDRPLLHDFSMSLMRGELVLVRGRNGAGKTSLLETLAGLRPPAAGEVERRAGLSWVGHRNGLNGALSAQENLEFWCGLAGVPRAGVVEALRRVGLAGRSRRRPSRQLSTGQRRRAALARLLIGAAPLWIVDEPLAGLDAEAQPLFAELLRDHAARGGATLLTTHQNLPQGATPQRVIDL